MLKIVLLMAISYTCNAVPYSTVNVTGFKNVAYFPNWATYARAFNPRDLNSNTLTHVLYAFANVRPDTGEVYLSDPFADTERRYGTDSQDSDGANVYGCVKQLFLQKKKNRNLKTLLSIGGWTYSTNFAQPLSTQMGRSLFATSAIQLLQDLGFDGLDIDWEYPQNESQATDFVSLLAELRKELDKYSERHGSGERMLLTVACPAGPHNYNMLDLTAMDAYLDFWNLMAYDYSSSGDAVSSHNANWNRSTSTPVATPFNTEDAVAHYIGSGILPHKIVIGIPIYGRSFANTNGPGQPFSGVGRGTWEAGVFDYKDLPQSGAQVHTDTEIGASWTYDAVSRLMVSFDTPATVAQKTRYIKSRGLGGAMWWESSGDKKGSDSLILSFINTIGGTNALEQSRNILTYPASRYENLKAGMIED